MSITRPNVTINVLDGGLGRSSDVGDGVPGIIIQTATAPTGHAYGLAKYYTDYSDLPELLQTEDMRLFFAVAPGAKIWVMPVAATETVADICDKDASTPYALDLINAGGGEIRFIGVASLQDHDEISLVNAQALAAAKAGEYDPVIVFLPVRYDAELTDYTSGSDNRVGVLIGENSQGETGLLLGRLASTPVQRHIGRIKDGSMPCENMLIGDNAIEDEDARVAEVVAKGIITLGTIKGKSGYYYETDPLATDPSGDFATIANRRVMDKAVLIAYQTYVNELKDEIEIASDGTIAPAVCKYYQSIIENAINQQMTAEGNISGASAFVDPEQNVLSTGKIKVQLNILPLAYANEITVDLGFTTSLEG